MASILIYQWLTIVNLRVTSEVFVNICVAMDVSLYAGSDALMHCCDYRLFLFNPSSVQS